jgi:hypothetical protein
MEELMSNLGVGLDTVSNQHSRLNRGEATNRRASCYYDVNGVALMQQLPPLSAFRASRLLIIMQ